MPNTIRKTATTVAALGALALGGSAIAGAATSNSTTANPAAPSGTYGQPPSGRPAGPHVGANGKTEKALTGDAAAKIKAAALRKLPGATIERIETNVDGGGVYEAHVTKADGSQTTVLLDSSFNVTSVEAGPQRP